MKKVKWIAMPAGSIMYLVSQMAKELPLQKPITMDVLMRAKDRYIEIASRLN